MRELHVVDHYSIDCTTNETGKRDIQKFLTHIKSNNYDFIIGLGIYSNKSTIIKFEKFAKNKFRNEKIENAPDSFEISQFLKNDYDNPQIKISYAMGNSWCNYSSFVIRNELIKSNLKAKNGFIHIPNSPNQIQQYSHLIQSEIIKLQRI